MPAGRKSDLTPQMQEEICGYIEGGATNRDAALLAGISESTFYKWLDRGKEEAKGKHFQFIEAIKAARAAFKEHHRKNIKVAGENGSWQASAWLLERSVPQEYGRRQALEHSGQIDTPVKVIKIPDYDGEDS